MQWFIDQWEASTDAAMRVLDKMMDIMSTIVVYCLLSIGYFFVFVVTLPLFLFGTLIRSYKVILEGIYFMLMCLVGSFVGFTVGEIIVRLIFQQ